MKTIELTQQAGADKLLRLTIPVDQANHRYHMVIVIDPVEDPSESKPNAWPPGFIESTYGSSQDESFIRQPQGEFENRLGFE